MGQPGRQNGNNRAATELVGPAKALDRLLSDPEYRAELGANAATRVKTMFDRETRIDTIAAAYENILAASPTE